MKGEKFKVCEIPISIKVDKLKVVWIFQKKKKPPEETEL